MAIIKQSFLANIVGRNSYDAFKRYAKTIIAIGTCILSILLLLSYFFHCGFISHLLSLVTGRSILFVIYMVALVITLDIEVDVDEPESYYWSKQNQPAKPIAYKLTIVWGIVLILLGIGSIYFSNEYRKHYAFECDTFLVDHQARIYHLDLNIDCEVAAEANGLERMKGYQIDKSYTLCDWCKDWCYDAEVEYDSSRYFRR